ncbi:hypothetical protein Bca4012_093043 [Brassica carinata]
MAAPTTEEPPPMVMDGNMSKASQFGKKSWFQAAQSKHVLVSHDVKVEVVDGQEMVEIPDDLLVNTVPLWEDFLEGRFLDPAPHLGEDSYHLKFWITDQQTRSRILRRGVWNIAGIPMILSKWAPLEEKKEDEEEVKIVPMWVTMKNVPSTMFSWKGLGFIASSVGKPVRLHPETELCSNFDEAKVFVNANMTKPLPNAYRFRSKSGINANIEFTYPWVPTKCSLCAKWGHNEKECLKKKEEVREKDVGNGKENVVPTQSANMEETMSVPEKSTKGKDTEEFDATVEVSVTDSLDLVGDDAVEQPSEVEEIREEIGEAAESGAEVRENWLNVSPGKVGRSAEKKQDLETVISPSRFQLLADEEEEEDHITTHEPEGDPIRVCTKDDIEEDEWSSIIFFMSQSQLSRTRTFLARYVFQTTLYMLWRERNSRKHGEKPRSPETLFRVIDRQVKNRTTSIRTLDKRLDMAFQD